MSSYVDNLINSKCVCHMDDERFIVTDRMGPVEDQNVVLTWEGCSRTCRVSITPDEVEILFEKGLIENVKRGEDGKLYRLYTHADVCRFNGAIVCGILSPTARQKMRPEIVEYAVKMGYVKSEMTPVNMLSGTKSLIFNDDGTYSISFEWNDNVSKEIEKELLHNFTNAFFGENNILIKENGVMMEGLFENEVFTDKTINLFREYDIQLFYLNPKFDKKLLLRALMQRAFIDIPGNILYKDQFEKCGNIIIPENKQYRIEFNEFGNKVMNCGIAKHRDEIGKSYIYIINVPYTEDIRELMIDMTKFMKGKDISDLYVSFSGRGQHIYIGYKAEGLEPDIERDIITLDYAMMLLRDECRVNKYQLYRAIISLLQMDLTGKFNEEYFSYLDMLKRTFPEKCEFLQ